MRGLNIWDIPYSECKKEISKNSPQTYISTIFIF